MKKSALFVAVAATLGAAYLGTVAYINSSDQALAEKKLAQAHIQSMPELTQAAFKSMTENGCQYCHSPNSEQPFYYKLPIANQLMQQDIDNGLKHFQIDPVLNAMESGSKQSNVALAKIERVLQDDTMPPKLYLSMHWGSSMSEQERQNLLRWVSEERAQKHANSPAIAEFKDQPVQPIYTKFAVNADKVALGEKLYFDTRFSSDNSISCASCHDLARGGVDNLATSTGVNGAKGPINAPTVLNAAFNVHQFWDGRAKNLQAQAGGPPLNPIEMASTSFQQIIDKLAADSELTQAFTKTYPDGWSEANITNAIAEYEKTLVTPNSRFDQYLMGNKAALTADEIEGYQLFAQNKCDTCHAGQALGGETFEVMGLKANYFADRGNIQEVDKGRFNVTNNALDLYKFKVPTLRNIALTQPYFHDAQAETLDQAVDKMAKYQVGVTLSQDEVKKISAFLQSLTGELNGKPLS